MRPTGTPFNRDSLDHKYSLCTHCSQWPCSPWCKVEPRTCNCRHHSPPPSYENISPEEKAILEELRQATYRMPLEEVKDRLEQLDEPDEPLGEE